MDYNSSRWIGYEDIEEYGSIQIIKNPYNTNKTDPTYIIIIFGINRKGTIAAGCRLVELWKDNFNDLKGKNRLAELIEVSKYLCINE
jgi:hypothetical protein